MPPNDFIDLTLGASDAPPPDAKEKPPTPHRLTGPSRKYAAKRAGREFLSDGGPDLAAMLTYYTVLSLAPALLATFSIISLVLSNNAGTVTTAVDRLVQQYVPPKYQGQVGDLVQSITGSSSGGVIALIIGTAVALWSASAYVKAFSRCMNTVYGRVEGRSLVKQTGTMLLTTLVMLIGIVLILIALAANQTLVAGVLGPIAAPLGLTGTLNFLMGTFLPIWAWVKWPVILILVVVMVAVLYYFTPNVRQPKFKWVSLGSGVAIVGIAVTGVLLSIYLTQFAAYSSYGAIGSVMALMLVLWMFNIMLLLGAEVDAEVERARELQGGIEAESNILLPPRDTRMVEKMKATRDRLQATGRDLRLQHAEQAADSSPEETETAPERRTDRPRTAERSDDRAGRAKR
ncbi:YihY/virulence factor BrkB family protein [Raineyella fluvialis]|uniref:YihY family inner membrane protein n=1 Tax=Raineyella fluvialis TaxID=2662261 RepID=A0A5Q2FC06_9ACTN|nr:YihY/virulence factor BrkB family protein [Raineyella fluvialis]QGF24288.1 YihY family inner membrane protein [Raineyella fluvialis]